MKQKLIFAVAQIGTDLYYGMTSEESAKLDALRDKRYAEARMFCGGLYLHGKLEHLVGYDVPVLVNQESLNLIEYPSLSYSRQFTHLLLEEEREYEVEVIGVNAKCIGFFWKYIIEDEKRTGLYEDAEERGLICLADDKEAIDYARQKLAKRSEEIGVAFIPRRKNIV